RDVHRRPDRARQLPVRPETRRRRAVRRRLLRARRDAVGVRLGGADRGDRAGAVPAGGGRLAHGRPAAVPRGRRGRRGRPAAGQGGGEAGVNGGVEGGDEEIMEITGSAGSLGLVPPAWLVLGEPAVLRHTPAGGAPVDSAWPEPDTYRLMVEEVSRAIRGEP